jgi:inosine/xanthosine triphosphate pyrophosphatase family protein
MSLDEKAALSHRAIATEKLVNFLDTFKIKN